MGQQQAALYLRLSGPGVRDVQRDHISVRQECAGRCGSDRGRQREHGCDLYLRRMGQYAV